jgi:glycogen debranching enzyme
MLLPAFYPVITPKDEDWVELQMTFSYTFKNAPHESHNGGLWPLVTGFYCASLALRGKTELAVQYLEGIHRANGVEVDGQAWVFPEYLHGERHTPGGTLRMGWSAAAAVIGHEYVKGRRLFVS